MKFTLLTLLVVLPVIIKAQEIPLWSNGAPGFENRKNEPTQSKDWWVKNIHNPTITVYQPPKENNTGTAVLICPGGGHRQLVITAEGVDPAKYLNSLGITAIVLKYRLAREENSPYTLEKHVRDDAYRAMRLVRSKAVEWNIDPKRIGIMGFSAGGEVVAMVAYASGEGDRNASDPIDKLNGKPDFQILIYPGPLFIPESLPKDAPPAFMLAAADDACCSGPVITLLQKYHEAKLPVEAHIYAKGDHGFNMGYRSTLATIKGWPQRMADWLLDNNLLTPGTEKK
ncbi:MAG TPA: alpha/beta hydrolase [Chryseolinea sp.]|nr:alpha/beta hydrolase [Chryseolinea sp.]